MLLLCAALFVTATSLPSSAPAPTPPSWSGSMVCPSNLKWDDSHWKASCKEQCAYKVLFDAHGQMYKKDGAPIPCPSPSPAPAGSHCWERFGCRTFRDIQDGLPGSASSVLTTNSLSKAVKPFTASSTNRACICVCCGLYGVCNEAPWQGSPSMSPQQ